MNIIEALKKGIPVKTASGSEVSLVGILSGNVPAPIVVKIQRPKAMVMNGADPYYMENYYPCGRYSPPISTNLDLRIAL
jgi:hypothetical protein